MSHRKNISKITTPVNSVQMTQAEAIGTQGQALSNVRIYIVDTNGAPTGAIYESGAVGSTPIESAASIKNNFAALAAPLVTNDSSQNFSIGSRWIFGNESYLCTNAAVGAAVWVISTANTISEIISLQSTLDGKSATTHNHDTAYTNIAHGTNVSNPHSVTKSQVSLGSVDNVADISKPISTAQQTALDLKVDKVTGKGLSANDYTTVEQTKLSGIATGATANSTDAQLRDRSTHTGSQAESTITNLTTDLAAKEATANKGVANGYAPLGANLLVPAANLPVFATSLRLMTPVDILEDIDRSIFLLADDLAIGAVSAWGAFSQATGTSQPTIETVATLGGRNAALFDSTSDFMESAANISLGTRYGLFAVMRTGSSIGGAGITMPILSEIFSGATVEYMFGLENGKFGVGHYNGAWRNFDATSPVPAINTPYIMVAGYDGANLTVKIDGGTASTAAQTSNPTLTEANNVRLGRRWDGVAGTGLVWNGHIACVIAKRNAYFTANEIAQLEGFAAWHYGLVSKLPIGHTYKLAPPLITA